MIICIIIGVISIFLGVWISAYADYFRHFFGGMCLTAYGALFTLFGLYCIASPTTTYYLEAEPLAHNQTQTVFTTDEGTYLADGLYPDGTYLLTVDGKDVLVVWQAVDGEVG